MSFSMAFSSDVLTLGSVVFGCILAPMIQIQTLLNFAWISIPFDRKVSLNDLTYEYYPDITLIIVLTISIIMTAFWALLILYLWPLYIEVDAEKPARFYYLFTKSFWCPAP